MRIVSDSCKCSPCLKKYYCKDYAYIISMQSHAKKFLENKNDNIVIVFQVEYCESQETRR